MAKSNVRERSLRAIALGTALWSLAPAPALGAQSLKPGPWYEDTDDLGFKLRLPQGWDFIPPKPGEKNLLGRCDAGPAQVILAADPPGSVSWNYQMWLVAFDQRAAPPEQGATERPPAEDLHEWIERFGPGGMRGWREDEGQRRGGKSQGLESSEHEFVEIMGEDTEVRLYALVQRLAPGVSVAVVFNGPGGSKWSQHRSAARALARTLRPIAVEPGNPAEAGTPRDQQRAVLEAEVARSGQWELHETPHYFVITNNQDREFISEALERLEAIREVFVGFYPPELAERLRGAAATAQQAARQVPARAAPAEGGPPPRTGVVRICASREQYRSYGGPEGTGGYFSAKSGELVLFDDKQVQGRDATWSALAHEAFHQFIHGHFGELRPHPWYNEGHGDFFGAFEYTHQRFQLARSQERIRSVQDSIRGGRVAPLSELVRWSKQEYYGDNPRELGRAQCYAQGWSLVYFLRTGADRARGWQPAWGAILDTYLEVLVTTGDAELALERAFAGVDWAELEACWRAYTLG
jgi:hypothetical protein